MRSYMEQMVSRNNSRLNQDEVLAVMSTADTVTLAFDTLPQGWEMMISPEGLEYYVDHNSQVRMVDGLDGLEAPLLTALHQA
jgi:hypothetical protein